MLRPGAGMIDFSASIGGVRIGFGSEIGLPDGSEFAKIMPEASEVAPLVGGFAGGAEGEHFGSKPRSPEGYFVQVAVTGDEG